MRKPLRNALAKEFSDRVTENLPQFSPFKIPKFPSFSTFEWKVDASLFFYLSLQPSPKEDEFTIEVAWSEKRGYPFLMISSSPYEVLRKGSIRFRLSSFWSEKEAWWQVGHKWTQKDWDAFLFEGKDLEEEPLEQALQKVSPQVEDAVQKILKFAVPYFKRIAAEHGIEIGTPCPPD